MDDRIRITVNGKPARTTSQAAEQRGITISGMRRVIHDNAITAVAHLDARTPLYLVVDLDRLSPPGRGRRQRNVGRSS